MGGERREMGLRWLNGFEVGGGREEFGLVNWFIARFLG